MRQATPAESQPLRWGLGLAIVVVVSLTASFFDELGWTWGLRAGAVILALSAALLLTKDESRWRIVATFLVVLLAASSLATAINMVANLSVYAISDLLLIVVSVTPLVAVSAIVLALAVKSWKGRLIPLLTFLMTVSVGTMAFLALIPLACDLGCWSAFGIKLGHDNPLPAVTAGLAAAAVTWGLVYSVSRRTLSAARRRTDDPAGASWPEAGENGSGT